MKYDNLIRRLYEVNTINPVKMGLRNIQSLYDLMGKPLDNIPIIHVGGTNGKGSVCLKTAECLKLSGLKTGLFVSPHISSVRERVQVNGTKLSEDDIISLLPMIFQLCEDNNIPATFFEIMTALAFLKFKTSGCEAVVLEVGLGGRMDSTNIIRPILSIITSVQLDHTKILGNTIEEIAIEKAGIMKNNVDILIGPGCPIESLREKANRIGSPFYTLSDLIPSCFQKYNPQHNNADIDDLNIDISKAALLLLERNQSHIFSPYLTKQLPVEARDQTLLIRPPCRFEVHHQMAPDVDGNVIALEYVFDVAHNEDALTALLCKIRKYYPNRTIRMVLGLSADKDIDRCITKIITSQIISPERIYCVQANHPRALPATVLRNLIQQEADDLQFPKIDGGVKAYPDIASGLLAASIEARNEKHVLPSIVLICGTFFIMAEARAAIGIVEPRDSDALLSDRDGNGGEAIARKDRDIQESFQDSGP